MIFSIISAVAGLVFIGLMMAKLLAFHDAFNFVERFGMGLAGGGQLLRMGPLLSHPMATPFDDWATTIMQIGLVLMAAGRVRRLYVYYKAHEVPPDAAHFKGGGRA